MAVNTATSDAMQASRDLMLKVGISPQEGAEAFDRALAAGMTQVVVFTMDMLPAMLNQLMRKRKAKDPTQTDAEAVGVVAEADGEGEGMPGNEIERVICKSWKTVLGVKQVALNDNFFELGGDSLTAIQAMARIKAELRVEIPMVAFYEAPTVSLLAQRIGGGATEQNESASLEEVEQRAGTRLEMMQRRRNRREQPTIGT